MSLVARSKKLNLPNYTLCDLNLLACNRTLEQTDQPVPDRTMPRLPEESSNFQTSGLVDQSPSRSCSEVGIVSVLSDVQSYRPVPEHIMLGGRYSPRNFGCVDLSTSPRAYNARWSVQSLDFWMCRLIDQSSSMSCSVVGTVPKFLDVQTYRPVPEHIMLGGRYRPRCLQKKMSN